MINARSLRWSLPKKSTYLISTTLRRQTSLIKSQRWSALPVERGALTSKLRRSSLLRPTCKWMSWSMREAISNAGGPLPLLTTPTSKLPRLRKSSFRMVRPLQESLQPRSVRVSKIRLSRSTFAEAALTQMFKKLRCRSRARLSRHTKTMKKNHLSNPSLTISSKMTIVRWLPRQPSSRQWIGQEAISLRLR